MFIKKFTLGFISVMVAIFVSTAYAEKKENNNDSVYTEDEQNIFITPQQSQFSIKLKSNPTTGYSWFLREYDNNIMEPIKQGFVAPQKKLIGAPGFELWTFQMKPAAFKVPQQTFIRLIYARPRSSSDAATQLNFRISTAASG